MTSRAVLRAWAGAVPAVCVAIAARAAPGITGVEVLTSVRQRTITVNVAISGVTATGRVRMTGEVAGAAGPVLALTAAASVLATPVQVLQMAAAWREAQPWEPGHPVRYRLSVRAAGDGWLAQRDLRFGFREWSTRGREFLLNGRPIRLRAVAPVGAGAAAGDPVARAVAAGFNAIVFTASPPGEDVLDAADEAGLAVICRADPAVVAGTHPSVAWPLPPGAGMTTGPDAHPARIGRSGAFPPGEIATPFLDPGRMAEQERDEWFSEWGRDGDRPVLALVRPDPSPAETRRVLRAWRLAGPASVALLADGSEWPAAPPAQDGWVAGPPDDPAARDHLFHTGEAVRRTVVIANDTAADATYAMQWRVEMGGRLVIGGGHGEVIPAGTVQTFPAEAGLPGEVFGFPSGRVTLHATIGATTLDDATPFRVFPRPVPGGTGYAALVVDPEGATSAWVKALGWTLAPWNGRPAPGRILVIGRSALDRKAAPGSIAAFVAAGGRALVMGQSPARLRRAGFEVADRVLRRMFPVPTFPDLPLLAAVDGEMLRDWRGFGSLVPDTTPPDPDPGRWHWGNRGSVCSAPVRKPESSGWTPLLEGGPDRAFSPLMELHLGKGLAILCTLDLEGRVGTEPAANHLATRLMDELRTAPVRPRAAQTVYRGGKTGESMLKTAGLVFSAKPDPAKKPGMLIVGADAKDADPDLARLMAKGWRLLLLPRPVGAPPLGFTAASATGFTGSAPPAWDECRGLSPADLRWSATATTDLLVSGPEVAAGGLLGRTRSGTGSVILLQSVPSPRLLTQLLANLGGSFRADRKTLDFVAAAAK